MTDIIQGLQDLTYLSWDKSRKSSGTAGSFLKSYDETGDRKLYYKLSDYDVRHGVVGHECINEIIAQRLLSHLRIPHLHYTLIHARIRLDHAETTTYLCMSEDFKKAGETKLALEDYYAMEKQDGESPLDFCARKGWAETAYRTLLVDFLIANRDRHGANIEVLFNRKQHSIRLAPLFDQGLSFLCRCHTPEEADAFDVMQDLRVQSFFGTKSAFENLRLIPKSVLASVPSINPDDFSSFFDGLDVCLTESHLSKIREMLERRWSYVEHLRNS